MENISVSLRIRPLSSSEIMNNEANIW